MDYRTFVRLTLNVPRVRLQRALEVSLGMDAHAGTEPLDEQWADAVGVDLTEGREWLHSTNQARRAARRKK